MMRIAPLGLGVLLGSLGAPWFQDPVKPAPAPAPTPAAAAPEVPQDGEAKPVPGKPKAHPLEGVYVLRERVLDGKTSPIHSTGYLCLTGRHLFLQLGAPGKDASSVLLRSGVRTWVPRDGGNMQTTVLVGWATDDDGTIHFEKPGTIEQRRIEAIRGGVRVTQDGRNWLDFERVE
jgi:hypothetical protein